MIYTTGIWTVREGSDEEFARVWRDMAHGMAAEFSVQPRLMRDVDDPRLYFTIAGPWRDPEQVSEALASARFADARSALRDHLESVSISTYELVAAID